MFEILQNMEDSETRRYLKSKLDEYLKLCIAMVNKFYDLASSQTSVPESVMEHYKALSHTASECIGCKGCESRCPFGVEVAARMEKTAELFGS